jgi:hypothetical protein
LENRVSTDETLGRLIAQFQDAADSSVTHRSEAERARDYYDGKQLTSAELDVLKKRKQPAVIDNRIADKVQYLLGFERRTRTDPKAYPRNPGDEGSAEAATDGIRYVFDCNDYQQVRSLAFENMLVEGVGACEVVRDGKKDKIRRIQWDRFYWDPHSRELDFSDAQYMGIVLWMDDTRLKKKYPNKAAEIEGIMADAGRTYVDTFDDKPNTVRFVDFRRKRIQVFEHYYWDGRWRRAVFMQGVWLEEPKDSPYLNEDGEPECAILAQCAYRDRDGNPYGVVRRYKDLQDEINKRRSKALHALSSRRTIADKGAVENVEKARIEVQRPDGWLEATPGMRVEVDTSTDIGMSQFQLLQDALQAMANVGPNAAQQGTSGTMSGRAKQVDAEGGAIQIGPLFDQIRHLQKRTARATWNRIKQFWTEETWVRVTDDEQKLKFVGLNIPVSQGEIEVQKMKQMGLAPEEMQARVMQIAMDPMSRVEGARKNDVATMHVDIIIDETPDTVTLQQEQFETLTQLAGSGVIPPGPGMLEVFIEASSLRNKAKMLEKLKGGGEQSPEQQQAVAEQQAMQKAMAEAEVRKAAADADLSGAKAVKTQVETAVLIDGAQRAEEMPPPEPPNDSKAPPA